MTIEEMKQKKLQKGYSAAAGAGAGAEGPGGQHGAERQRGFFVWQSAGKEAG